MSLHVGAGHVQTAPAATRPDPLATAQVATSGLLETAPMAQSGVLKAAPVAELGLPSPAPAAQPRVLATALPAQLGPSPALGLGVLGQTLAETLMMTAEKELVTHDEQMVPLTDKPIVGSHTQSARSTSHANSRHTSIDACR